jgi:hypothetical protein
VQIGNSGSYFKLANTGNKAVDVVSKSKQDALSPSAIFLYQ